MVPAPAGAHAELERQLAALLRPLRWFALDEGGAYRPVGRSRVIAAGPAELAGQLDWPAA